MFQTALLLTSLLGTPPAPPPARPVLTFQGTCDASGAVELMGGLFLVGDDENNVLRVYDGFTGGSPRKTFDLSAALGVPAGRKQAPETDIEAATPLPPYSFWMTSHGRRSSGKQDPNRFRFFATRTSRDGKDVRLAGKPYTRLLEDLLAAPQLAAFGLAPASELAPKADGGLNVEGLTVREEDRKSTRLNSSHSGESRMPSSA